MVLYLLYVVERRRKLLFWQIILYVNNEN
jgi:hypothetical protein